ncbi:unnamed protein product [Phytophthora lilii]|uniref:Unnamed protein product n=1 Tax=Phytophthora lilii TaxID=2077276 RepID=A0A9W6TNT1_9STRA|nr:unnamed protein product [Phytophthora lilii]
MRTSGGAGAGPRRPRDATPGALNALTMLLVALLLGCSPGAAESAPASTQQRREWSAQTPLESHVVVGADGFASSRGAGRQRSDGLSITHSLPVETGISPEAPVDDQAIKFTPPRIDLGRMETCSPQRYYVGVENRGRVSVRLDGADFTHEGFSLANDVRGIRLDPGDRFNVQFVFLPRKAEPNGVDAHLRVLTTSGLFALPISSPEVAINRYGVSAIRASLPVGARFEQSLQFVNPSDSTIRITEMYALDRFVHLELLNGSNWIGPRWPRGGDDEEVEREVPGEYDPNFDYARRANRGAWDMPAGARSPLIKVSVRAEKPGVYFTYIHIAAGERRLLLVPVRITVLKPGLHIEPKELDLGVLTESHEDQPREVFFTLYNAGFNPLDILELKVLDSNLIVSAQLWGGSTVIPPRTQLYNALAVQIRVDKTVQSGACFASLLVKTNASSSELGQRKLKLYGQVIRGSLAFQLKETLIGAIMPLENVFIDEEKDLAEETTGDDDQETPTTKLVSIVSENASIKIMAGTSDFRKLRLWNQFDRPVELQRVWVASSSTAQEHEINEVTVYKFKQAVAPSGSAWPKLSLEISPALRGKSDLLSTRIYPLVIETNVTRHFIQIYVYHGFLSVNSHRGLQNYSVSGYNSGSHNKSCLPIPAGGNVPTMSPRIDGGDGTSDTKAVQLCRSLLFDLEKVALHRARTEVVEITNENPVPATLSIISIPESVSVGVSITAAVLISHSINSLANGLDNHSTRTGSCGNEMPECNLSSIDSTQIVSVGDSYVLQPGYKVVFYVEVRAKETLGELTVPVMSIATPIEVLHFHARFQSVQGTVEPITPALVLPAMFPGRTKVIHLKYRNTFEYSVTPLTATLSSSKLKLLSIREVMAPKQVENVLDLLFSPADDTKCYDAQFLADCLLPLPTSEVDQTCEQLSGYGELVDDHDLAALQRRNAFWSSAQPHSMIEAQVHLRTDILDDVAEVTIKALLERPLVTVPALSANPSNRSMEVPARKEFSLTELLNLSNVSIRVRNPSNISIQMELATAAADQALFYSCDEDLDINESWDNYMNDDESVERDSSGDISTLCLANWKATASELVHLQRDSREGLDVPSFYLRRRIILVSPGEEAELGPVYYLPSRTQNLTARVFVRNDLSHIEPVQLVASSGKGTLNLLVDTLNESLNTAFIARKRVAGSSDIVQGELEYGGTLSFDLTLQDSSAGFSRSVEVLLSNTGQFGLTVYNVAVENDDYTSWGASAWASDEVSEFLVTEYSNQEDNSAPIVLPPGKSAHFRISFCASCFAASVASWLIVDTSDSIKRIRLKGTITTDAAFSCLRSRAPLSLRYAIHSAWVLAVVVATISALYTLFVLVHDVWTSGQIGGVDQERLTEELETNACQNHHELEPASTVTPRSLASINKLLLEMEKAAFASPAHTVTPAVAELLERRHKGFCSTVHSNLPTEDAQLNKNTSVTQGGGDSKLSHASVEVKENQTSGEPERISPSDGASTATAASLQDAEDEVSDNVDAVASDVLRSSTNAHQPAFVATTASDKLLGGDDLSSLSSDESSEEDSSELSSASSSHSTIVQPDAEKSSRGTDFTKKSLGSPSPLNTSLGSSMLAPVGTANEEGPFEAFKSLSARWRAEDWHGSFNDPPALSLSGSFPTIEDWNDTLSVSTFRQGPVGSTDGNQRGEYVDSGNRREPSSFIGTGPGLFRDEFSTFGGGLSTEAAPMTTTSTKKAPPGFTPADAKPLETRAAFERLQSGKREIGPSSSSSNITDGFGNSSVFASKLPMFGPALAPTNYSDHISLGGVGRIGSGRSKVLHATDTSSETMEETSEDRGPSRIGLSRSR